MKTDQRLVFLHVDMEAGHGGKAGRFQRYRQIAMEYAFVLDQAGIHE
jgi:oligopeptidase B